MVHSDSFSFFCGQSVRDWGEQDTRLQIWITDGGGRGRREEKEEKVEKERGKEGERMGVEGRVEGRGRSEE
jgi:LmbE family N-acetylglucosaminyl deacetylase